MELKKQTLNWPVRQFLDFYEVWRKLNVRNTRLSFMINYALESNKALYHSFMNSRGMENLPESYSSYVQRQQAIIEKNKLEDGFYSEGMTKELAEYERSEEGLKAMGDLIIFENELTRMDAGELSFDIPIVPYLPEYNALSISKLFFLMPFFNADDIDHIPANLKEVTFTMDGVDKLRSLVNKLDVSCSDKFPYASVSVAKNFSTAVNLLYRFRASSVATNWMLFYERPRIRYIESIAVRDQFHRPVREGNSYHIANIESYQSFEATHRNREKDTLQQYEAELTRPITIPFFAVPLESLPEDLGNDFMSFMYKFIEEAI